MRIERKNINNNNNIEIYCKFKSLQIIFVQKIKANKKLIITIK